MKPALALAVAVAAILTACSGDDASLVEPAGSTDPTAVTVAVATSPTTETGATTVGPTSPASPASSPSVGAATSSVTTGPTADWCSVAEDLYGLTTAFRQLDAANTAAVQMSLVAILERLDTIAGLVPPQLAADLDVSAQAFELLDAALAAVGYDVDAADLGELDARADEIAAANDRIRAYNADECGIAVDVTGEGAP